MSTWGIAKVLSQTAEYALRAMVFLAMKEAGATTEQIAHTTKVPSGYLSKILQQLGRSKLVVSQRGIGGGFVLSRASESISILVVINAVAPIEKMTSCPLGVQTHEINLCPLHKRISEAISTVEAAFAQTTLSELVKESQNPLCSALPFGTD